MSTVRSGLLAAWASAWLAGEVSYDEAVDAVTGTDQPHRVVGLVNPVDVGPVGHVDPVGLAHPADSGLEPDQVLDVTGVPLGWLLATLRDRRATSVRLVLPVPGDPRGLPGPGPFTSAAIEAGEAVLGGGLGIVPTVTRHGSAVGSATISVRWTAFSTDDPGRDPLTVAEAEHALGAALREATSALLVADVASWRPEVGEGVARVRRPTDPRLPPRCPPRAVRLLAQADRLADVLELADADAPGGAVTSAQAVARDAALRPLRTAVRRARVAAYNAATVG
ncbi:MAG TPA: hypothetical protein VIS06_16420 [Mycobacteriales bacterium]